MEPVASSSNLHINGEDELISGCPVMRNGFVGEDDAGEEEEEEFEEEEEENDEELHMMLEENVEDGKKKERLIAPKRVITKVRIRKGDL
jgi:hypothetical protein